MSQHILFLTGRAAADLSGIMAEFRNGIHQPYPEPATELRLTCRGIKQLLGEHERVRIGMTLRTGMTFYTLSLVRSTLVQSASANS